MKAFFLVLTWFTYTIVSCEDIRESSVPSVVINTLNARFSNAKGVEWEKKANGYEAEFTAGDVDHTAFLDASGKLVRYKQDIACSDLPAAVVNTIHIKYSNFRIDDVEKIEKGEVIFYQAELDGAPGHQKLVIDAGGKVDNAQSYW